MPNIKDPHGRLRAAELETRKYMIRRALALHPGNMTAAAEWLGVGRRTLYAYLDELGLREETGIGNPLKEG